MSKTTIDALVVRRDRLRENVQRVKGRLDSARADLASVEEECLKKKVDPEKIDVVIDQLTTSLESEITRLQDMITLAESQVAPFLEEDK